MQSIIRSIKLSIIQAIRQSIIRSLKAFCVDSGKQKCKTNDMTEKLPIAICITISVFWAVLGALVLENVRIGESSTHKPNKKQWVFLHCIMGPLGICVFVIKIVSSYCNHLIIGFYNKLGDK